MGGVGVEDDFFIVAAVGCVAVAVEVGQVLICVGKEKRSRSYGLLRAVWCFGRGVGGVGMLSGPIVLPR